MLRQLRIGCAGWAIPARQRSSFPGSGSHLERYAQRFTAVEIDSSFRRPHQRATYERWAAAVPENFSFAVKAPEEITHGLRLTDTGAALDAFLSQVSGLGGKLGPLLFQLPPSLAFNAQIARLFFSALRSRFRGLAVCEPRHPDWFADEAGDLLMEFAVSRAAVDPPVTASAGEPGGWRGVHYFRLHGSPRIYYSQYTSAQLESFADRLASAAQNSCPSWCIFDNTAASAAIGNALALQDYLRTSHCPSCRSSRRA